MRIRTGKHQIDGVFVLLLFSIFAVCILLVLLTGAGSYRRLMERDTESYDQRIAVQYVAAKIRGTDAEDCVFTGDFDGTAVSGGNTLHLLENIDGVLYDTRVYYYDGYIRELFAAADASFLPADGNPVLAARNLTFDYDGEHHLLTVAATDQAGSITTLVLALRSGEGAGA
jgi:hypothetical protein